MSDVVPELLILPVQARVFFS